MMSQNADYGVHVVADPLPVALGGGPRPTASAPLRWKRARFHTPLSTDAITHNLKEARSWNTKKGSASFTISLLFSIPPPPNG